MGKGARIRAQRAAEAARAADRQAAVEAIGELLQTETFEGYVRLIERRPLLSTETALEVLEDMSRMPGYGPLVANFAPLVDGARSGELTEAWSMFQEAIQSAERLRPELDRLHAETEAARAVGDHARVVELIGEALPLATRLGYGAAVCEMLNQRGVAYFNLRTKNRADEVDAAIEAFEAALDVAVPGEQAASLLMHLGLAFGDRVHGDHADNLDNAIGALRAALEQLNGSDDDELRAMVQTNLAVALGRGERGERVAVAREAVERCRAALRVRSIDRDPEDWAYSHVNLGEALRALAQAGGGEPHEARAAFHAVIEQADAISDLLVGFAHHALGRMDVDTTRQTPEDILEEHRSSGKPEEQDPMPALRAARAHFETAAGLVAEDPIRRGRVLDDLADVLAELGDEAAAVDTVREALTVLRPTTAPDACKEAAWRLGHLLAERGDWQGAAAAMREAVEAAELAFHARFDTVSREREVRGTGNLHRWAAYAIARAGDPKGAALVLDAGRGREIGRRLGVETPLTGVPTQLQQSYRAAISALAATPLGGDSGGASRQLQEVIGEIRTLPGHRNFGTGPRWEHIVAAVEPGWPVLYVDPAPAGTLLLALRSAEDREVVAKAAFADATSQQIFLRLMAGGAMDDECAPHTGDHHSYLFGITKADDDGEFLAAALDEVLPWLGETLARPIEMLLDHHGATGVTLVVCGPLGLAPLHAASWRQADGTRRCLIDRYDVRYVPSAVVGAAARRRAARERPAHLVALADPHGDLPAAGPEVREIAELFGSGRALVAVGPGADAKFLRRHGRQATHLHFACHARGGLFHATDAAVSLASGEVAASELTTVGTLDTRLVVASACQSAVSEIAGMPDEVVSIATAMLASGSACAIASLWPVDDLATALLMTRLYHEMLTNCRRPPEALRRAQLWLRGLGEEDEAAFLARHPALAEEFERRARAGRTPGRRRGGGDSTKAADGRVRPYAHPDLWAPFIAVGV